MRAVTSWFHRRSGAARLALLLLLTTSAPAARSVGAPPGASKAEGATTAGSLAVPGLRARVTVRRDARGIPYIEAANEHDLFLAQGFVTASDRLWQMDLLRRSARGELAEILGRAVLEQDEQARILGFGAHADALVAKQRPRMREALAAYAAGVNAYIASRGAGGLPAEFGILGYQPTPWRPSDSLVIGKIFALDLTMTWPTDFMRATFANLSPEQHAALFVEESPLDVVLVGGTTGSHEKEKTGATLLSRGRSQVAFARDQRSGPRSSGRRAGSGNAFSGDSGARARGRSRASASGSGDREEAAIAGSRASVTSRMEPLSREALARARSALRIAWRPWGWDAREALSRTGLPGSGLAASNDWVVSGRRSETGRPILANDPHLGPSAPSIWYLTHLSAPGVHVAGVTPPGCLGVALGHNERIAWGVTNLMADVQDLYAERFDAAGRYRTPAGSRAPAVRKEKILVRSDKPDGAVETIEREVTITRHGPIVFETGNQRYALRWTALDPDACELAAFFDLTFAGDWNAFTAALEQHAGPPLSFVYADTEGHIGFYAAGRIPVRASGDGTVPCDGATDAAEWTGYVPFRELPHLFDPPSGAIVTANNRIAGKGYPHLITRQWEPPYRARRIADLLAEKPKLSVDDHQAIQADTYSYPDAIFARAVLQVAKAQGAASGESGGERARPEWSAMVKALDGWDGRSSAGSRVLPLVVGMRRAFAKKVIDAALGSERAEGYRWPGTDTFIDRVVTERPASWLPKGSSSYEELLLACWNEARASLASSAGADETQWTWGRVGRKMTFPHPLAELPGAGATFAIEPLPRGTGGSNATVNAGNYVSMRLIADLADWDRTRQGIALGESGDPRSPHWKDQIDDWRNVRTRAFPFSREAVARAAVKTEILLPVSPSTSGGASPGTR